MMARYRKCPVEVEAHNWYRDGWLNAPDWYKAAEAKGTIRRCLEQHECLEITTLEGTMIARPHDWIIRGVKGELYPCRPDIFAETYELVEEPTP